MQLRSFFFIIFCSFTSGCDLDCPSMETTSAMTDTDLHTCSRLYQENESCKQIGVDNIIAQKTEFDVTLYLMGAVSCDDPLMFVFTKILSSCSGDLGSPLYYQCANSYTDQFRSDMTKCYFSCTCPERPCDRLYVRAYVASWEKLPGLRGDDVFLCEIGLSAKGNCVKIPIENPSFEDGLNGWNTWGPLREGTKWSSTEESQEGVKSLALNITDPSINSGVWQYVHNVSQYKNFKVKVWAKAEIIGIVNANSRYSIFLAKQFSGSQSDEWKEGPFDPGSDDWHSTELFSQTDQVVDRLTIVIVYRYHESRGVVAYFDNVQLWDSSDEETDCNSYEQQ